MKKKKTVTWMQQKSENRQQKQVTFNNALDWVYKHHCTKKVLN